MEKTKEAKLTGNEVVVQDNRLIDAPRTLTLQQQKLFLFLVSKLDPKKPEDIIFRISANEFANAVGIKPETITNAYRDMRKIIKCFMSNVITIVDTKENKVTDIPMLGYAEYWPKKGYAEIQISPKLAPYLFDLQKEFTQYKLSQIINLSSIYAVRIYELLKKNEMIGHRTFLVDDLRKKLKIATNKLKGFKEFRERVLEIAQREINEKTDITIDFNYQKTGRKITAIEFKITSKDERTEYGKSAYTPSQIKYRKNMNEVMELGASKNQARNILEYADSSNEVEEAIYAVKEQMALGNVNNPTGMLKTAIKEKWKPNKKRPTRRAKSNPKTNQETTKPLMGFSKLFEYISKKMS